MLRPPLPVLLALAAAPAAAQESPPPLESVPFPRSDGATGEAHRGVLVAPVVRGEPETGTLRVVFHRFPCEDPESTAPPIYYLNGGPGFEGLEGDLQRDGFYERNLRPLARLAEVVVVGQRGIGTSTPDTRCGMLEREPLHEPFTYEDEAAAWAAACAACKERWEAEGLALRGLNVLEAAADVVAVADALGHERIQLVGSSFGSHWAMAILREHGDRVARALLGGTEGPDHTYDMPSHVLAALRRIAAAADAAPELSEHVPEGGLLAAFEAVVARVEEEPVVARLGAFQVRMDARRVRSVALGYTSRASSRRGMRTWPRDVIALAGGDFTDAAAFLMRRNMAPQLPTASYFMLDCGSGISAERLAELESDPAARVVGPLGAMYRAACPVWGADLGEDFRAGFTTDVPTVIVHGNWDTSTPIENAFELLPSFERHRFVLVEGGSHGALGEALRASPAFRDALDAFLATGDWSRIPGSVDLGPLDWAVPE